MKFNKIKTFKDQLLEEQLGPNDMVVETSGHRLIHEAIALNKRDIFTLLLLYKRIIDFLVL